MADKEEKYELEKRVARWLVIIVTVGIVIWNAFELHYNTKKNTAIIYNDMRHIEASLTEMKIDIREIKSDIKELTLFLLTERKPITGTTASKVMSLSTTGRTEE